MKLIFALGYMHEFCMTFIKYENGEYMRKIMPSIDFDYAYSGQVFSMHKLKLL